MNKLFNNSLICFISSLAFSFMLFDLNFNTTELEYFSDEENEEKEEEGSFNCKITCSTLKKFVHEVRTTRGYGVDVKDPLPSYMHCPFRAYSEYGLRISEKWVNLALHHAIKYINNSNEDGKVYQHVNTLKVVDTPHRVLLLTFTAKQFLEVSAQTAKQFPEVSAQKKRKMEVTAADEADRAHFFSSCLCTRT